METAVVLGLRIWGYGQMDKVSGVRKRDNCGFHVGYSQNSEYAP